MLRCLGDEGAEQQVNLSSARRFATTAQAMETVDMTFEEIGRLVGGLLRRRRSGRLGGQRDSGLQTRHVQAHAWLGSGREVESVDRARERVRFSAAEWRRGS